MICLFTHTQGRQSVKNFPSEHKHSSYLIFSYKISHALILVCYLSLMPLFIQHFSAFPHYFEVNILSFPTGEDLEEDLELVESLAGQVYRSHPALLSKGFALSHPPTIHQALDAVIPFRSVVEYSICIGQKMPSLDIH